MNKKPRLSTSSPPPPPLSSSTASPSSLSKTKIGENVIVFQQFEIDHYIYNNHKPIIRMFGLTSVTGHSVCCHVHDFLPYFYVKCFDYKLNKDEINASLKNSTIVIDISPVYNKKNIYGYQENETLFWKITVSLPKFISIVKHHIKSNNDNGGGGGGVEFFESNVEYELRFMVDTNLMGCSWIELPPGTWHRRKREAEKQTRCQLEFDVRWNEFIAHAPENEWGEIAPLKILSFDIECNNRPGIFPEPEQDQVIQIGNVIQCYGSSNTKKIIFTLKNCAPIEGVEIKSFHDEFHMLEKWAEFIRRDVDPDILMGYNINKFDFPYLLQRVSRLEQDYKRPSMFYYLGRVKHVKTKMRENDNILQSKQFGNRTSKIINIEGRCQFDMMLVMVKDFKLRSYSLNAVSLKYLSKQKEDVHPSAISTLQNGDEQSRRSLALYCIKDATLPLELMWKLASLTNYIEMARVAGIPLPYLITRGLQIKIFSQILRKARNRGFIIPALEPPTIIRKEGDDDDSSSIETSYQGATVIEPCMGYYNKPIATLDFASLYPSIMIAYNLCYTTFLTTTPSSFDSHSTTSLSSSLNNNNNDDMIKSPSSDYFVHRRVRKGLLPEILEFLIEERKKVKGLLKSETDFEKKRILDSRQLALKVYANAIYGFTGAQVGKLPCLPISRSVTAYGREMLDYVKNQILNKYTIVNGYTHDSKIIYGDTDSVMIDFFVNNNNNNNIIQNVMNLGKEAADFITRQFNISPIKLEFEKVYFPYLLINKKRYAGLIYTTPDKYDKLDCKGLETVRRDNCLLVTQLLDVCLKKILIERNPEEAITAVKMTISDLLGDRIDMSQLVITKELSKKNYAGKQAHVYLADKMKKRDPNTAPKLGDRIPYVVIKVSGGGRGKDKMPIYKCVEDPLYVLENSLPIDYDYYLNNQLRKPLLRIFEPILSEKTESILFKGKHTLSKVIKSNNSLSLFSKFIVKCPKVCLGCKFPIIITTTTTTTTNQNLFCKYCDENIADDIKKSKYEDEKKKLNTKRETYLKLWNQCVKCQKDHDVADIEDLIPCTNKDCPIFYARTKAKLEYEKAM